MLITHNVPYRSCAGPAQLAPWAPALSTQSASGFEDGARPAVLTLPFKAASSPDKRRGPFPLQRRCARSQRARGGPIARSQRARGRPIARSQRARGRLIAWLHMCPVSCRHVSFGDKQVYKPASCKRANGQHEAA